MRADITKGNSEVRDAGGDEPGVITAGVTGYKVYGAREWDVEDGRETVVVLTCA